MLSLEDAPSLRGCGLMVVKKELQNLWLRFASLKNRLRNMRLGFNGLKI